MIKDLSKVITLPRELQHQSNTIDYICGCQICSERVQKEISEKNLMQDAIHQVEQMLESTVFSRKDLSLQFMRPQAELSSITIDQLNEHILRMAGRDIAFTQLLLALVKFTHQFNKKYRHPLICELHDNNLRIIQNLGRSQPNEEYHQQMSRLNGLLSYLRDQEEILGSLHQEAVFSDRTIAPIITKLQKAIVEIKFKSQQAIIEYHTRTPQHEFAQNIILVKPSQKMV